MESAAVRRAPPLADVVRLGLIGLLLVLALVAWLVTDERMAGMDAGPGTDPGTLGFYVTVWVVMMAAMMFPSVWPTVVMQVRMEAGRRERGERPAVGATPLCVGGYLVAWTAVGLAFYAVVDIGRSLDLDAFSWSNAGP